MRWQTGVWRSRCTREYDVANEAGLRLTPLCVAKGRVSWCAVHVTIACENGRSQHERLAGGISVRVNRSDVRRRGDSARASRVQREVCCHLCSMNTFAPHTSLSSVAVDRARCCLLFDIPQLSACLSQRLCRQQLVCIHRRSSGLLLAMSRADEAVTLPSTVHAGVDLTATVPEPVPIEHAYLLIVRLTDDIMHDIHSKRTVEERHMHQSAPHSGTTLSPTRHTTS